MFGVAENRSGDKWSWSVKREDVLASASTATTSLLGTVWSGVDSDHDSCRFEFLGLSVLRFTTWRGTSTDASWSQDGQKVELSMSKGYAHYHGTIDSKVMFGIAENGAGKKWSWAVKREP
jgi:hypothetical protein